jgi:light-regulated signal transduction histidine kinase (bacteriophytochrome)
MPEKKMINGNIVEDVLEKIRIYVKLRELEQSAIEIETVREQLNHEATDKFSEIENYLYYALDTAYDNGYSDGGVE